MKSRSGKNPTRKRRFVRRGRHSRFGWRFELESFINTFGEHNAVARQILHTFCDDAIIWELMDRAHELTEERAEVFRQIEARQEELAKPLAKKLKGKR